MASRADIMTGRALRDFSNDARGQRGMPDGTVFFSYNPARPVPIACGYDPENTHPLGGAPSAMAMADTDCGSSRRSGSEARLLRQTGSGVFAAAGNRC